MRYLLLVFCLLFSSQVYGQKKGKRKGKVKAKQLLSIQGGLLIDHTFNEPMFDKTYTGFNLINLGWSKIKNNTQRSFQLELIGFKADEISVRTDTIDNFILTMPTSGFDGKRRSIELLYNHSFGLTEDIANGFFMGPSGSLIFNKTQTIPLVSAQFPSDQFCLCLGLGTNAGYNWSINKNLMLSISSRVTLLDIGWQRTKNEIPGRDPRQTTSSKFQTDFLRRQFQVNIGLNFKI